MAKFTKETRQRILREYLEATGREIFDPADFVNYVRDVGPSHEAFDWFTWEDQIAAGQYRIDQARDFARGLKIRYVIQNEVAGPFNVKQTSAPMLVSPMANRNNGGGYIAFDPEDPAAMLNLRKEAANTLRWFISRYEAALLYVHADIEQLQNLEGLLEGVGDERAAA